jgi:FkbM family methyltransferase
MNIKGSIQRLIRGLGWEVRRLAKANVEHQVLKDLLDLTGPRVILDVGANSGQWGDAVWETGFDGTLVSFEAIPSVHAALVAHARRRGGSWKVAPCAAIGGERGQIEFNISANKQSSSVLPMRPAHFEAAPESRYVDKQIVPVERLDDLATGLISPDAELFVKIDTQGYEREVLKGAAGLLTRTVALQMELSLVALYEGAPTFMEMISLMESQGYELFNVIPVFKDSRTGRMLQVDGFFIRSRQETSAAVRAIST